MYFFLWIVSGSAPKKEQQCYTGTAFGLIIESLSLDQWKL